LGDEFEMRRIAKCKDRNPDDSDLYTMGGDRKSEVYKDQAG